MAISKRKTFIKISVITGALLFAGFFLFLPQQASAINFTAGWYRDHGGTKDNPCGTATQWQGHIEFRNAADPLMPLQPIDELEVEVLWYKNDNTVESLFREEIRPIDKPVYKTGCIETKGDKDKETIVLHVRAVKNGFYTMVAANSSMKAGDTLSQATWKKTLYMAPADDAQWQNANIAFTFPAHGQWISNNEDYKQMEIFVRKASGPGAVEDINEIKTEIKAPSGQTFTPNIDVEAGIAEGKVRFDKPNFTEQGEYIWSIISVKSGSDLFYNENVSSKFNFDSVPPYRDRGYGVGIRMSGTQTYAPRITITFEDHPPSSGVHEIEIYLDDDVEGDNPARNEKKLRKTCTKESQDDKGLTCKYYGEYKECSEIDGELFEYYALAYDYAGNQGIYENSFTVWCQNDSELIIESMVSSGEEMQKAEGVSFRVNNVTPLEDAPNFPELGGYTTTKTFYASGDYEITTEFLDDSYNGKPFSFVSWCNVSKKHEGPINFGYTYHRTAYFGATRFYLRHASGHWIDNFGQGSESLSDELRSIGGKVTQEGGTPGDLLPEGGLFLPAPSINILSPQEYKDLIFEGHDSECGTIRFKEFTCSYDFCDKNFDGYPRKCKGSLSYENPCSSITPRFLVQRTIKVETYLGATSTGGVAIEGNGGMESGTTGAEGYYEFSSTEDPDDFIGTLWATSTITVGGEEFEFGEWRGCQSKVGDGGLGCYIGTDIWYHTVATTVEAHYASSGEDPEVNCAGLGILDGQCGDPPDDVPDQITPYYCESSIARPRCNSPCSCPPGYECVIASDGVCCPIAAMECDLSNCLGPGCVCDNNFSANWETFNNPDVIYYVNNTSQTPDITGSIWSIVNYQAPYNTCPISEPLCGLRRMPFIDSDDYIIQLEVQHISGHTGTTSYPIKVKQDTIADFKCSLENLDPASAEWKDCDGSAGITPLSGQIVYFRGDAMWSEGATEIASSTWERVNTDTGDSEVFAQSPGFLATASTTLTRATSTVRLIVKDNHPEDTCYPPLSPGCQPAGRSAEEEKTLNVRLPLPEYREVRPRSQLDNFLARLSSIFLRF